MASHHHGDQRVTDRLHRSTYVRSAPSEKAYVAIELPAQAVAREQLFLISGLKSNDRLRETNRPTAEATTNVLAFNLKALLSQKLPQTDDRDTGICRSCDNHRSSHQLTVSSSQGKNQKQQGAG